MQTRPKSKSRETTAGHFKQVWKQEFNLVERLSLTKHGRSFAHFRLQSSGLKHATLFLWPVIFLKKLNNRINAWLWQVSRSCSSKHKEGFTIFLILANFSRITLSTRWFDKFFEIGRSSCERVYCVFIAEYHQNFQWIESVFHFQTKFVSYPWSSEYVFSSPN